MFFVKEFISFLLLWGSITATKSILKLYSISTIHQNQDDTVSQTLQLRKKGFFLFRLERKNVIILVCLVARWGHIVLLPSIYHCDSDMVHSAWFFLFTWRRFSFHRISSKTKPWVSGLWHWCSITTQHQHHWRHCWPVFCTLLHAQQTHLYASMNFWCWIWCLNTRISHFQRISFYPQLPRLQQTTVTCFLSNRTLC